MTSHGKQPCDRIGGTVKRLATQTSLQIDLSNHILYPQAIYKYCNENIECMHFIYISSENLTLVKNTLSDWILQLPYLKHIVTVSLNHLTIKK